MMRGRPKKMSKEMDADSTDDVEVVSKTFRKSLAPQCRDHTRFVSMRRPGLFTTGSVYVQPLAAATRSTRCS